MKEHERRPMAAEHVPRWRWGGWWVDTTHRAHACRRADASTSTVRSARRGACDHTTSPRGEHRESAHLRGSIATVPMRDCPHSQ
eukprot:594403-Prymnesium_polylepis.1